MKVHNIRLETVQHLVASQVLSLPFPCYLQDIAVAGQSIHEPGLALPVEDVQVVRELYCGLGGHLGWL